LSSAVLLISLAQASQVDEVRKVAEVNALDIFSTKLIGIDTMRMYIGGCQCRKN